MLKRNRGEIIEEKRQKPTPPKHDEKCYFNEPPNMLFPPKRNYLEIQRYITQCFKEKDFHGLKTWMSNFSDNEITDFFTHHGYSEINHALSRLTAEPLAFFINNVPSCIIKNIISNENWKLIRIFLGTRKLTESCGQCDQQCRNLTVEKLKCLLQTDCDGIQTFMLENSNEYYMTNKIKEDFQTALRAYKEEQQANPIFSPKLSPSM